MVQTATVRSSTRRTVASPADKQELAFSEIWDFERRDEDNDIDNLQVYGIRCFEQPTDLANPPAPILVDANLLGVKAPISLSFDEQVFGVVMGKVSGQIIFAPGQRRPVPDFSSVTGDQRLLLKKRMPSAAVGPVSSWLH
ncbi:hypothetical protein [Rhodoferax sp. U11-2br]|uniref:hypothetical protein n=1 Tax=Rhodoferax sp. U11-2br TaxID=2838878 RepID=UPI001BE9BFAD|nr:hypothetical protein [Rhodoferax sp. U11-2br]MBT3067189.1 hypothetical protein [Rhodoferax sp. U11-2br]